MTVTIESTVSASDAAVILRAALGDLRAWSDFLSDNIRGRQSIHGLSLMPCAQMKVRGHFRPRYSMKDIKAFIAAVKRVEPSAGRTKIEVRHLPVKYAHWRINRFDERGKPVARASYWHPSKANAARALH